MSQVIFTLKVIAVWVEKRKLRRHPIVVYVPCLRSLSYVNEWLGQAPSVGTSLQYAKILQRFCNYLAKHMYKGKEDEEMLLEFWLYANCDTLIAWKTHRLMTRNISRRPDGSRVSKPSNRTVDRESDVVSVFLDWVKNEMKLKTNWDGSRKTIKAAKSLEEAWLTGIVGVGEREVVVANTNANVPPDDDYNNPLPPEAHAKRSQDDSYNYLYDDQIAQLIEAFPDKVYGCIALAGYLTGVRSHEAMAIPWHHVHLETNTVFSGDPGYLMDCIRECPSDKRDGLELSLKILGKGGKDRTVKFPAMAWLTLMNFWQPLRNERKKLYKARTGQELPNSILWVKKDGEALYCPPDDRLSHITPLKRLQDAFTYVTRKGRNPLNKVFNLLVSYYTMRHTYATNFMIRRRRRDNNYNEGDYIKDLSLQQSLSDQMGHTVFDTTFKKYIIHSVVLLHEQDDVERPQRVFTFDNLVKHLHTGRTRK